MRAKELSALTTEKDDQGQNTLVTRIIFTSVEE